MSKEVALINGEGVVNVIIADDAFMAHIANEFDHVVDITDLNPRPGIGWSYVNGEFCIPGSFENGQPILNDPVIVEEPTE